MGSIIFSGRNFYCVSIKHYLEIVFCALIAVTTLAALNPFRTGQMVLFEVTYDTNWHYFEIPIYIILGIFEGYTESLSLNLTYELLHSGKVFGQFCSQRSFDIDFVYSKLFIFQPVLTFGHDRNNANTLP